MSLSKLRCEIPCKGRGDGNSWKYNLKVSINKKSPMLAQLCMPLFSFAFARLVQLFMKLSARSNPEVLVRYSAGKVSKVFFIVSVFFPLRTRMFHRLSFFLCHPFSLSRHMMFALPSSSSLTIQHLLYPFGGYSLGDGCGGGGARRRRSLTFSPVFAYCQGRGGGRPAGAFWERGRRGAKTKKNGPTSSTQGKRRRSRMGRVKKERDIGNINLAGARRGMAGKGKERERKKYLTSRFCVSKVRALHVKRKDVFVQSG